MLWWDTARIEQTITRQFVVSRLQPSNVARLDDSPGFGDGLTDGTYWEWIEDKAKRFFLVLVDVGIPDKIFEVVDQSCDDDDLPLSLGDIERVLSGSGRDHKLSWKVWDRQFYYIMRRIEEGCHLVYGEDEVVPVEIVDRKGAATLSHNHYINTVVLLDKPGRVFARHKFPANSVPEGMTHVDFLSKIRTTKRLQNEHIVSYFASYTHLGSLHVLMTHPGEYNLKTVLTSMPGTLKTLSKQDQLVHLTMDWIHCLVEALCSLHSKDQYHGNIRPSSIGFDSDHKIILADTANPGDVLPVSMDKTTFNKESYDYAAPEQWFRPRNSNALYNQSLLSSPTSPSFENHKISINRGQAVVDHHAGLQSRIRYSNAQAADIFSAGCIILELLGLLFKRSSKSFAAHRGAKHKLAGRGGAPLDMSFHMNLGQVESWMAILEKDARKKQEGGGGGCGDQASLYRGIPPMLQVVARMLSASPRDRPTAHAVEQQIYRILTDDCGMAEPHCVHNRHGAAFDLGLESLQIRNDEETTSRSSIPISIPTKRRTFHFHRRSVGGDRGWLSPIYDVRQSTSSSEHSGQSSGT